MRVFTISPKLVALAVLAIALRLGTRWTDRQQGRSVDSDVRGRSIEGDSTGGRATGCVAQPTSVTSAIAVMMKSSRMALPHVDETALGRFPELIDIFTPGNGERHRVSQFFNQ